MNRQDWYREVFEETISKHVRLKSKRGYYEFVENLEDMQKKGPVRVQADFSPDSASSSDSDCSTEVLWSSSYSTSCSSTEGDSRSRRVFQDLREIEKNILKPDEPVMLFESELPPEMRVKKRKPKSEPIEIISKSELPPEMREEEEGAKAEAPVFIHKSELPPNILRDSPPEMLHKWQFPQSKRFDDDECEIINESDLLSDSSEQGSESEDKENEPPYCRSPGEELFYFNFDFSI